MATSKAIAEFICEKDPERKKEIAHGIYLQMDSDWENTQEQIAAAEECFGKY